MPIHELYSDLLATHLNKHAVWEPGDSAKLGEYGVITNGVYEVIGTIDEFITFDSMSTEVTSGPKTLIVASKGVNSAKVEISAALAELRVSFTKAKSLWMRGCNVTETKLQNVNSIASALLADSRWKPNWLVTYSLDTAASFTVLVSENQRSEVVLKATPEAVRALDVDGKAGASIEMQGEASYSCIGKTGPLLRKVFRANKGLLGGTKLKFRAGPEHGEGWEEVAAGAPDPS